MPVARALAGAAVLVAALATGSVAGAGGSWLVEFGHVPTRAVQGSAASISVHVRPAGTSCDLLVRYSDGSIQLGFPTIRAASGVAVWHWRLAPTTPVGAARVSVVCGRLPTRNSGFTVVAASATYPGSAVVAKGFSQRPDPSGPGSAVSYGVVLRNPATDADATNVKVLVNLVDARNRVLRSATARIPAIGAAATFELGGAVSLPVQTPVTKLEVVVETESFVPRRLHAPSVQNVQVVPSGADPTRVGEVDATVANDDPSRALVRASLSIVLFDSSGAVVGGGTGSLVGPLPPGARSFVAATAGFSAVDASRAKSAAISVEPTYATP